MSNLSNIVNDSPIKRILIVDDESSLRKILTRSLTRAGFECSEAISADDALRLIESQNFELVISDISMPEMDGIELLKKVKIEHPNIDFIMMTGYASDYSYVDIMDAGASDYMTKPFNINSAIARISRIVREKRNLISLRKANDELSLAIEKSKKLAQEARDASKAKTFFLASMSHEIRTPLNGIVGYTDMLLDTTLNAEQQEFLKNAKISCDTLLSVVNDILDFSKVEAGKLKLETIEFDPEVICFDAIEMIRTKVDESKVEIISSIADSVPVKVKGDPHRLRQVLLNLLGNAAKFTKQGFIKLELNAEEINEDKIKLHFSVQDTGIGIAESELESIFLPFNQSEDDIIINRYGGTGLGLAISRNIALKMNGDIFVESVLGQGSTFYFVGYFDKVSFKKSTRIRPVALKEKTVLLCSSENETRTILNHEFLLAGMKVIQTDFDDMIKSNVEYSVDDIHIGVIDFGKTSKNLLSNNDKRLTFFRKKQFKFPLIACSIPFPGVADILKTGGFKGYLPKPVQKRKLFEMISFVLGMAREPQNNGSSSNLERMLTSHLLAENLKQAVNILLVEDNPVNQKMTQMMLTKAGYTIDLARDGLEAVEKYTHAFDDYDLIFMDINMPKMNGFQATEKIRIFEKEKGINPKVPILALTANVMDDFKEKCYSAGMDDFLTKPIKRELVFQSIQKWNRNLS